MNRTLIFVNIFLLLCVLVFKSFAKKPSTPKRGTIYYIDQKRGHDSAIGTDSESPWKTLKRLEGVKLGPADQVLLRRGSVFHETLNVSAEGEEGAPIVIGDYGEGKKPLIYAPDFSEYAVLLYNVRHLTLQNLEVVNTGSRPLARRTGVKLEINNFGIASNITLFALDIRDVNGSLVKSEGGGSGILIKSTGKDIPSKFDHLTIEHCTLKRCERNGIIWEAEWQRARWHPSTNVRVRYNSIEEVPGDGIVPIGCDGAVIEYNRMFNSPATLPDTEAAAGIWPWSCDNTLIQYNEVSGHKAPWDAQGFDSDYNCTNTTIQYNYSHQNEGGFLLVCNSGETPYEQVGNEGTKVVYNLSIDDAIRTRLTRVGMFSPTIHLAGPVKQTQISNNIILVGEKPNDQVDRSLLTIDSWGGYADSTVFSNNLFVALQNSSIRLTQSTSNQFYGNYFYGEFSGLKEGDLGQPEGISQMNFKKIHLKVLGVLRERPIGDGSQLLTYVDSTLIHDFFSQKKWLNK